MRSNVVFGLLIAMLGGLFAGLFLRARAPHELPAEATHDEPSAPSEPSAPVEASSASPTALVVGTAAPTPVGPKLDRPLRVVALDWELLAAGVMAAGGAEATKDSIFGKHGLEVQLRAVKDTAQLENALARGGKDEKGADIGIVPLPRFVASYERLEALKPVMFFTVAWSDGREVVMSKESSLAALPARGEVPLNARAGDPAAFLALFTFDLAGVAPERVKLGAEKADWRALTRAQSKAESEQLAANLIVTTAQASRLIPFVAFSQGSLVQDHTEVLAAFAQGWLEGHARVASDASEASRQISAIKGAPEPLEVLAALGQIRPASLLDNAHLLDLAGRDPVTLASLFERSWDVWRRTKVLTIPPETPPVDGRVVAAMVRSGGNLEGPPAKPSHKDKPTSDGPIVVHHAERDLSEDALVERVGFAAGAFPRSPIAISLHPRGVRDDKLTDALIERVRERYGLPLGRLVRSTARPQPGSSATLEIRAIP